MERTFAIVEPVQRGLERLDLLLADWPGWRCVGRYQSQSQAHSELMGQDLDLVFVSVDSDFEWVDRMLAWPVCPPIIALSRSDQRALACLERGLHGYLIRPFEVAKIEQVKSRLDKETQASDWQTVAGRSGSDWYRISVDDVLYATASDKRTNLMTLTQAYQSDDSLDHLQRQFPEWVRIRRDTLIPISNIQGLERQNKGWAVRTRVGGAVLPVSRRALPALRRSLALAVR